MGTEVAISFSTLRAQLENEKSSLFKIDENIKKIVQTTGRFSNDRFNASGEYARGGNRIGARNSFPDSGNNLGKIDDHFGKRKQETKTVFSRLSARTQDSDGEDEAPGPKRARVPSTVCRELPTRAAVLRAQGDDEQARTRNRRIFGSLLGTLQKFKQEEIVLQTKEEKRAQVERKIEEQARQEKEREQKERKSLFVEREHKKATIKALEAKMGRVQEFEKWETSQKQLSNFILTKAKPHLYWIPKKMNEKAEEKLTSSRKYNEKCLSRKKQELQDELQRIEQRCLHTRGPGAKENDPSLEDNTHKENDPHTSLDDQTHGQNNEKHTDEERGKKRDKFAMDVDQVESEGEDHHDEIEVKQEGENKGTAAVVKEEDKGKEQKSATEDSKMDTSTEANKETETSPKPTEIPDQDTNVDQDVDTNVELNAKNDSAEEIVNKDTCEEQQKDSITDETSLNVDSVADNTEVHS